MVSSDRDMHGNKTPECYQYDLNYEVLISTSDALPLSYKTCGRLGCLTRSLVTNFLHTASIGISTCGTSQP